MRSGSQSKQIRLLATLFPKTVIPMLEENIIRKYSEEVYMWAQGKRRYPYKLEKLHLYSSKSLQKSIASIGIEEARRRMQERLQVLPGDKKLSALVELCTKDYDEMLRYALVHEIVKMGAEESENINLIPLHIFALNLLRVSIVTKLSISYSTRCKFEEMVKRASAPDSVSVSYASIEEFSKLVSPSVEIPWIVEFVISTLLKKVLEVAPDQFVVQVDKLLQVSQASTHKNKLKEFLESVLTSCLVLDSPTLETPERINAFKMMIYKLIDHNIDLAFVQKSMKQLLTFMSTILLKCEVEELVEIRQLYIMIETLASQR